MALAGATVGVKRLVLRLVPLLWLMAALSLVGWLLVHLDVAGWILLILTMGLMTFELMRRPVPPVRPSVWARSRRPADQGSGQPRRND